MQVGIKKLFGGFVGYYLASVAHPQRPDQVPYVAECEDIIEALQMTPNEANEFKELWRTAAGRLDPEGGKAGHTPLYGAQKRCHYARRDLLKYERQQADIDASVTALFEAGQRAQHEEDGRP